MNNDEMIRTSEGPQMVRDAKRMQQELEVMQRKLGQLRRKLLLAEIEHCSGDSSLHGIWLKLKPEEQEDKEIIYKFLASYWCSSDTLFGRNPWSSDSWQWGDVKFPQIFLSDPQAVLAFVTNDRCLTSSFGSFQVPEVLRDNQEVMMAVCAKFPQAFQQASSRLRDDENLFQTVLHNAGTRDFSIGHVSQRLLQDNKMWDYALTKGYCTPLFTLSWMNSLDLGEMDINDQEKIAITALHCISGSCHRGSDYYYELDFLSKLAVELRNDADFMLPFVKFDWTAIQWCSYRLRSNMWHMDVVRGAVSKNINAYQYVEGPILEHYQRKRNVDTVLAELQQGLYFENVPEDLQANRDIIMAAWECGNDLYPSDFPEDLKHDKDFILELIAAPREDAQVGDYFYSDLPVQLQLDEDVARALLKAGFPSRIAILFKVPSLLQSREAMMDAVALTEGLYSDDDEVEFSDLVARCSFRIRNDEEFMLKAYKADVRTFEHASERLRSNRRFLRRLLKLPKGDHQFITYTTDAFQVEHQDFIVKVIKHTNRHRNYWLEELNHAVWSNKNAVLICLQKGWSIMELIRSSDMNSPHFSDEEVVFLSVKNHPADLKYASKSLREDRDFVLELVKKIDRVLHHAPGHMKRDKEILLAAVARSSDTISDCFCGFELDEDFEFLCEIATEIRSAIATHHSFKEFLGGIYACHPYCPLSTLNLGSETSIALKKKIAEFAGIGFPMGSRLQALNAALTNMEKLGY